MAFWCPGESEENDPKWWATLERVAALTQMNPRFPTLVACEFMFMGREDSASMPSIWLYKHKFTRRYINLDDAGHAHRYVERWVKGEPVGGYVVHRRLLVALEHLELEIVPAEWRASWHYCPKCELARDA